MKMLQIVACLVVVAVSTGIANAGGGTALTYQGRLLDAGVPANGTFNVDFSLWDHSAGGIQVGSTISFISLPISDGLFTVQLDFGANAFDNAERWLEISVDGVPLTPRQPITRAPYAIQTRGIVVDDNQLVGMGVSPGQQRLRVWNFAGGGAVEAVSSNRAIEAISTEGDMAILASNQSVDGMAVFAQHQPSQNQAWLGTPDYGVYGRANDVVNDWAGYFLGRAHVSDRLFIGREEPLTFAEYFGFNAPVDSGYGGMYISTNTVDGWPFYGYAAGGTFDMWHYYDGTDDTWKLNVGGSNRVLVRGDGKIAMADSFPGFPFGGAKLFVSSDANSSSGVIAFSEIGAAIGGVTTTGLAGQFVGDVLIQGNCDVNGDLTVSGNKAFQIDHPLDPAYKYLYHYSTEGPDPLLIYRGNVILDGNGEAWVELPDYFEEINRDFHYQLTAIGAPGPNLYIAREIANNQFKVAGGQPLMKVSWTVTGVRNDPYMREYGAPVEQDKPAEHRGKYLHPELYGQPKEMAVHQFPHVERPVTETALAKAQAGQTTNLSTGELK